MVEEPVRLTFTDLGCGSSYIASGTEMVKTHRYDEGDFVLINEKLWWVKSGGEVRPFVRPPLRVSVHPDGLKTESKIHITTAPSIDPKHMTIAKKRHFLACFYRMQHKMTTGLLNLERQIKFQLGLKRCRQLNQFLIEASKTVDERITATILRADAFVDELKARLMTTTKRAHGEIDFDIKAVEMLNEIGYWARGEMESLLCLLKECRDQMSKTGPTEELVTR